MSCLLIIMLGQLVNLVCQGAKSKYIPVFLLNWVHTALPLHWFTGGSVITLTGQVKACWWQNTECKCKLYAQELNSGCIFLLQNTYAQKENLKHSPVVVGSAEKCLYPVSGSWIYVCTGFKNGCTSTWHLLPLTFILCLLNLSSTSQKNWLHGSGQWGLIQLMRLFLLLRNVWITKTPS